MPFPKEFTLPTEEELTVEEVNLSFSALRAASIFLGKVCEKENNEFMLCKRETQDPRKCLEEGKLVTKCTLDFFKQMKKHCCDEFNQYANCLFRSSSNMDLKYCRNTQAVLDKCVLDKMELERPPFGWQAEVHIHKAKRPKPEEKITLYPDAADVLPPDYERKEPKHGVRFTNV